MKSEGAFTSVSHTPLKHNFAALPTSWIMRGPLQPQVELLMVRRSDAGLSIGEDFKLTHYPLPRVVAHLHAGGTDSPASPANGQG